ncbi:MAG: metallophosphoesterase [Clostridia bacterium]|nr:metallophosphoesterase [Clostridia bacterium]
MMPVKWGDVLSAIKNEKAEYVVVTGDLVNKAKDIERAKQFVLTLALGAEIPVIITLGNHDNEVAEKLPGGKQEFIDEFKKLGGDVRVLDDEYTIAGGTLIGGLGDVATGQGREVELVARWAEIAKAEGLEFVLATHNADLFVKPGGLAGKINELAMRPSCVLCGHTHGGQIRLIRHLEFSVIKNDKLPKRGIFYGRHEVEGFDVYITSGLGCSALPLRSGTHPEVVVVILSRM